MGTVETLIDEWLMAEYQAHKEWDDAKDVIENADASKLATALREAGMVREWGPIETAPKDGTEIVGRDGKTGTSHVTFNTGYGWHDPDSHYYSEAPNFVPTHWMPLQTPPPQGEK